MFWCACGSLSVWQCYINIGFSVFGEPIYLHIVWNWSCDVNFSTWHGEMFLFCFYQCSCCNRLCFNGMWLILSSGLLWIFLHLKRLLFLFVAFMILLQSLIIFYCQPTLHKPSIIALKVRVLPGEKTIRFHYANCEYVLLPDKWSLLLYTLRVVFFFDNYFDDRLLSAPSMLILMGMK